MKVLYIITGLGMGGAEHVVINLADALATKGHQVRLIYLTGPAIVRPTNPDVDIIPLNLKGARDLLRVYFFTREVVKSFQPDIIHSHMFHSNILARLIRLSIKVPVIISTAHSNNEGGNFRMLLYRVTDWLADITTNVSKDAVQEFIKRKATNENKILDIPNGVNTNVFYRHIDETVRDELNISNDTQLILCVGRLDIPKDYPNLFHAIKIIKKTRQDFKVVIVGDGPLNQDLKELARQLDIFDYLMFLGIRTDIARLMSASDIFVLPSKWEGFGLVVAEAMACECLVVATDCGGISEVVKDYGILVPPSNSEALANQIEVAFKMNNEDKRQLGLRARQHIIDNYSLELNVNNYLNLYKSKTILS